MTIPFKGSIIPFLRELDGDARKFGAVNTVVTRTRRGYNTDGYGFLTMLENEGVALEGRSVLVLGAGGFEVIREFQRSWSEIGFVPIKQKDAVQKRYKALVDALFDTLRGSERDRSMNRFRDKVSSLKASGDRRLRSERERLYNKVRQMEQEIALLENNIGFFAKSKNADTLVADVQAKIDRIRSEMAAAIEKVKLIDREAGQETAQTEQEER